MCKELFQRKQRRVEFAFMLPTSLLLSLARAVPLTMSCCSRSPLFLNFRLLADTFYAPEEHRCLGYGNQGLHLRKQAFFTSMGPLNLARCSVASPRCLWRRGEVLMATRVARQMDDCVLFLPPCSRGSWLPF